ncbi:MAG: o-succinylbenzoate synthase, partial [Muribaculaceae bacterium]|nr:o-succinylbenzoate synthase [Muribaculaceae bacterium]
MTEKTTYFIVAYDDNCSERFGVGECALVKGLSDDDRPDYEERLRGFCADTSADISNFSSIRFGVETAINDLANGGRRVIFPSKSLDENRPVKINGLIWMGDKDEMTARIRKKIEDGFHCLKLKIGGLDFDEELKIIKSIRDTYSTDVLEIRLDANGAFSPSDALSRLDKLSLFGIHSIEQPIRQGQWEEMADICLQSPIPIALDEELIGVSTERQCDLLDIIKPQYIILKPSLCGGFSDAEKWISAA